MSTTSNTPESQANQQPDPKTTIAELRKQYGEHFAKGYGDQDTWGEVSGRAGVTTVQEYLEQGKHL